MPVDRLYQGTEPIAHPLTGELIELDDRDALFRAWVESGNEMRRLRQQKAEMAREQKRVSLKIRALEIVSEPIVYALAGQDVTRGAARDFARDEIDQGC